MNLVSIILKKLSILMHDRLLFVPKDNEQIVEEFKRMKERNP